MGKRVVDETSLTAVADAIRAKAGTSGVMEFPNGFTEAIGAIQAGGGGGTVEGYATVTFHYTDQEGEKEFSRLVMVGDDCPDPVTQGRIDTPTKESTVDKVFTHNGWSGSLENIQEDTTFEATFTESVRYYTATLCDEDGSVLYTEQVPYGSMPSYVPEKTGTGFAGWTPNTPVTGDTSYTAVWTTVLATGTYGNAVWSLDSTYTLTVSGTGFIGASSDTTKSTLVPEEYRTLVKTLVIEDGFTNIFDYCFKKMSGLTTVILPESITYIGQQCFNSCSSLVNINLPSDLTSIADRAFAACTSLTSITIPSKVTKFFDNAFYGCSALTSVNIPTSVTVINARVFSGCTALTSATFEDTEGWTAGTTALASADLANPATAATYLRSTHVSKVWTKS